MNENFESAGEWAFTYKMEEQTVVASLEPPPDNQFENNRYHVWEMKSCNLGDVVGSLGQKIDT